jgi:hypothetical protein
MRISGIYKIINKVNGKYYVGSSNDIKLRWIRHKYELNKNKHYNLKLQRAWNKYNESNFNFVIVEFVPENKLLMVEQTHLNICKNNPSANYNLMYNSTAPMMGRKHTSFTLEKMSASQSGKNNPMYGMISSNRGKTPSVETKQKMSKNNCRYWTGKTLSENTKRKMSQSHVGEKNARYGKHHTTKSKELLSLARRDKTIFVFRNNKTNEVFSGTTYDLSQKFSLIPNSVRALILKKMKILKGWVVV